MKKWITIACLLLAVCQMKTFALAHDDMESKLLRQLSQVAEGDTTRLQVLYELVQATKSQPEARLRYIDLLLKEAEAQNNNEYKCHAYLSRIYVAYNMYDAEGVNHWASLLEPLALKEKLYDLYFMGKQCAIDFLLVSEQYELEEKESFKLLKEAQTLKNNKGIIVSYQCLANVYQMTYRHKEGISVLEKAYKLAVDVDEYSLAIEVNRSLLNIYEALGDNVNRLKYIEIQEDYVKKTLLKHPEEEANFTRTLLMVYISRLSYFTEMKDFAKAEHALQLATSMKGEFYGSFNMRFHTACYNYYEAIGEFEKALVEVDALSNILASVSPMSHNAILYKKASILYQLNRYDAALDLYKTSHVDKDSIQLSILNKQTEHIRQNYDADTLMLKRERTYRYVQISSIMVVSIIILIFAYFVVRTYIVHNHLQKSERKMREMAQEMERMNLTKERFLSSISTGINDPLNAIVTGSLRLVSDKEINEAQRFELSESINSTSTHLMKLINNILDLSRLESGMMKYTLCEIELVSFIQSIATSVAAEHTDLKVHAPTGKRIIIETDVNRLTGLFKNLFSTDPDALDAQKALTLELTLPESAREVHCRVYGTILVDDQTQDIVVMNEINRLVIEHFGGTYQIVRAEHKDAFVMFVLPMNPAN